MISKISSLEFFERYQWYISNGDSGLGKLSAENNISWLFTVSQNGENGAVAESVLSALLQIAERDIALRAFLNISNNFSCPEDILQAVETEISISDWIRGLDHPGRMSLASAIIFELGKSRTSAHEDFTNELERLLILRNPWANIVNSVDALLKYADKILEVALNDFSLEKLVCLILSNSDFNTNEEVLEFIFLLHPKSY